MWNVHDVNNCAIGRVCVDVRLYMNVSVVYLCFVDVLLIQSKKQLPADINNNNVLLHNCVAIVVCNEFSSFQQQQQQQQHRQEQQQKPIQMNGFSFFGIYLSISIYYAFVFSSLPISIKFTQYIWACACASVCLKFTLQLFIAIKISYT